jgi:hypothetical protein
VVVGERMFRRGFESGSAHGWDEKAGRRGGQQLSSIKDLSLYFARGKPDTALDDLVDLRAVLSPNCEIASVP